MAVWGPAVKPGDEARITSVVIKSDRIHFELNGGPIKKQKWYQHIEIGGTGGGTAPIAPSDQNANPRGTYVDLVFDHYVPDLTPQKFKDLLRPVLDFDAKSALEAYLYTVPPKVKEAIQNHQVLVGMNREMLIYSKGRPPKKIREKDGEIDYEEWIYGEPPQIYDYLRILFARLGQPHCPACQIPIGTQTADEIIDKIMSLPEGTRLYLLAPIERRGQGSYESLWDEIRRTGFT